MSYFKTVVLGVLVNVAWCDNQREFPLGFKFGAATAAYQIEGAWNVSDKGESIWDRFVHSNPGAIENGDNGDVAADSYHNWQQDIDIASDLGLHFYRFSVSWPRLLPTGFTNIKSEDGKNYYSKVIDGLLAKGIEPIITLYHWDLPQTIQDLGGWTNPLISDYFADYADYVFSLYGDRVKTWITINEAICVCDFAYNSGTLAPGIKEPVHATYLCNKHILVAHAKAYRIYDNFYRAKQDGKISFANNLMWIEPLTAADEELAELGLQHTAGRYSHPIYSKKGGWPTSIEKVMEEYSKKQGFNSSILPAFTHEELKLIRGTYDFYAFNHYTTRLIRPAEPGEDTGFWFVSGSPELNAVLVADPSWPAGASNLLLTYPQGIRRMISWLKKEYGDLPFLITENGYSSLGHELHDPERIQFIKSYLEQVLLSIWEDGAKVFGYTYWSLIDNFEWVNAYSIKFGLYAVDYNDTLRARTPRHSARYYAAVIRTNAIDCDVTDA